MTKYSEPFLLSEKGSTRATAYNFGNKSGVIHVSAHFYNGEIDKRSCGVAGEGCKPPTETEVYCVMIEDIN